MSTKQTTYTIEVEADDKKYRCIITEPSVSTKKKALSLLFNNSEDIFTPGSIILSECFQSGDSEILTDSDLNLSAAMQCIQLIKVHNATLKKN